MSLDKDIALLIYRFLLDKNKGDKMELNRVIIKNNIILNKYIGIERNNQKEITGNISFLVYFLEFIINSSKLKLLFISILKLG